MWYMMAEITTYIKIQILKVSDSSALEAKLNLFLYKDSLLWFDDIRFQELLALAYEVTKEYCSIKQTDSGVRASTLMRCGPMRVLSVWNKETVSDHLLIKNEQSTLTLSEQVFNAGFIKVKGKMVVPWLSDDQNRMRSCYRSYQLLPLQLELHVDKHDLTSNEGIISIHNSRNPTKMVDSTNILSYFQTHSLSCSSQADLTSGQKSDNGGLGYLSVDVRGIGKQESSSLNKLKRSRKQVVPTKKKISVPEGQPMIDEAFDQAKKKRKIYTKKSQEPVQIDITGEEGDTIDMGIVHPELKDEEISPEPVEINIPEEEPVEEFEFNDNIPDSVFENVSLTEEKREEQEEKGCHEELQQEEQLAQFEEKVGGATINETNIISKEGDSENERTGSNCSTEDHKMTNEIEIVVESDELTTKSDLGVESNEEVWSNSGQREESVPLLEDSRDETVRFRDQEEKKDDCDTKKLRKDTSIDEDHDESEYTEFSNMLKDIELCSQDIFDSPKVSSSTPSKVKTSQRQLDVGGNKWMLGYLNEQSQKVPASKKSPGGWISRKSRSSAVVCSYQSSEKRSRKKRKPITAPRSPRRGKKTTKLDHSVFDFTEESSLLCPQTASSTWSEDLDISGIESSDEDYKDESKKRGRRSRGRTTPRRGRGTTTPMKGRGTTNRMRGGGTASPKVDQDNLTLSKNMERLQSLRRKLYRPRTPPTKSGGVEESDSECLDIEEPMKDLNAVRELVSLSSEEEEVEPNQETGPSSLTTARRRRLGPKTTAKMREIFEGYSEIEALSSQTIKKWLRLRLNTLVDIFRGKIPTERHEKFHKGPKERAALEYDISTVMLTREQFDTLTEGLNEAFCSKSNTNFSYMYLVLVAESIVYLIMDFHQLNYIEAEHKMFNYYSVKSEDCVEELLKL